MQGDLEAAGCGHPEPTASEYRRRRPDKTVLYELVRDYAETLFAEARDRSGGGHGYPAHVENEFRRYIECGVLGRGFMRVHCDGCGRDELVAFSCKGRALCPSCVGRRMSDRAARLVDVCLPVAPYRQWVFSFPWRIRLALAKETSLLSEVLRVCLRAIFAYQRKRARAKGIAAAKTLAVCFVQRFGSLLQLNPHGHVVVPDGVFYRRGDGTLGLCELEVPTDEEVEAVGLAIVKRVLRVIRRTAECAEEADDDPTMTAVLAEATTVGVGGVGAPGEPRSAQSKRRVSLIQTELGAFSIHANTSVEARDRAGLERLLRYCGRAALAHKRLSVTAAGKVRYQLRKPYHTGQTEVVLEPVAFLRRLAALVPPARQNQVRYYGLLAAQASDRDRLLALVPTHRDDAVPHDHAEPPDVPPTAAQDIAADSPASSGGYRLGWARLLQRVFIRRIDCSLHRAGDRAGPDHASVPSAAWSGNRGGGQAPALGRRSCVLPIGSWSPRVAACAMDQLGAR